MPSRARQIREVRKRLGLTQGDFAARLGVSQTSISRWEKGTQDPDLKAMLDIGRLAGVDPIGFALGERENDFGAEVKNTSVEVVGTISDVADRDHPRWEYEDRVRLNMPLHIEPGHLIEAFRLDTECYEPDYKKGSIIFTALYRKDKGFYPKNDDLCVCFDRQQNGLWKNTLMRFRWERGGRIELKSLKLNPFETIDLDESVILGSSFWLPPASQDIFIVGVVIASFFDEASHRLPKILEDDEADD